MLKFFRQPITPWCNLDLLNVWIGKRSMGKSFIENDQRYCRLKSPLTPYYQVDSFFVSVVAAKPRIKKRPHRFQTMRPLVMTMTSL